MKQLKVVGLGVLIWGIGLLWPAINEFLTPPLMAGVIIGLGVVVLRQMLLSRHLDEPSMEKRVLESPYTPRSGSDSQPVKPLGLV